MRAYFTLLIFCFISLISCNQKSQLEKASPFTAVKWENDQPIVQFKNVWYRFEKIDNFSEKEILDFCKKEYGTKWQKRFSEDLIEVLQGLNYAPNEKVVLELSLDNDTKVFTGILTYENRQLCLNYNRKKHKLIISKEQAIQDLNQFQEILDSKSSYAQLSSFDYTSAIKRIETSIIKKGDTISVDELTNELSKIISKIDDRHSSIKNMSFNADNYKKYDLKLPFGLAPLNEKLVAVQQNLKSNDYAYYNNTYPYIKSINGMSIEKLIDTYNYRDEKAPKQAKLTRGGDAIQDYGALLFKNNMVCPDSIQVVFSNGKIDKIESLQLTTNKRGYNSKLSIEHFKFIRNVRETKQFNGLSKILNNNIGYIKIPMMFHYKDIEGLEIFTRNSIEGFSKTKALIIDVRNNPGGGREILQTFANYIIQPKQSPWVANVAYLRSDIPLNSDEKSMRGRYLYTYNSDKLSNSDREAIDLFNEDFKVQKVFDNSKFSSPFYMVLHAGKISYTKPIYILANERSFSAATVFVSAFKGVKNVKIVGVTTDGSSGNSKNNYLNNSKIRVKFSTMLSFQRNGKTLDGNGTEPDIYIPENEEQILKGKDVQLKRLIEIIN